MSAHDAVNHPKHYTDHPSGVECIQITEHMNFNLGNAIKYIWRAGLKEADASSTQDAKKLQDLEKAAWYVKREIARLKPKPAAVTVTLTGGGGGGGNRGAGAAAGGPGLSGEFFIQCSSIKVDGREVIAQMQEARKPFKITGFGHYRQADGRGVLLNSAGGAMGSAESWWGATLTGTERRWSGNGKWNGSRSPHPFDLVERLL